MLLHSARDIETPGLDQVSGYGLLDARAALQADPAFFIESIISSVGAVQEGSAVVVQVSGTADADRFAEARVEIGMGETPESWTQVGTLSDATREGPMISIPTSAFEGATEWTIRLIVRHEDGRTREARFFLKLA